MKFVLLAVLFCITFSATAQRIPRLNDVQDLRQRLNALNLTLEQKRRITNLIRRERLQYYMNQRELNQILSAKQKEMLMQWRKERERKDSVRVN